MFACASLTCDSGDGLPGAPTTHTTGYVIYEGAGFAGTSAHLEADLADLQKPDGPCKQIDEADSWDDCVSSIRLSPGTRIVAFVDADFKGWGRTVNFRFGQIGSMWVAGRPRVTDWNTTRSTSSSAYASTERRTP